jgi:hypothetical protein
MQTVGIYVRVQLRHARAVTFAQEIDARIAQRDARGFHVLNHIGNGITREVNARALMPRRAFSYRNLKFCARLCAQ